MIQQNAFNVSVGQGYNKMPPAHTATMFGEMQSSPVRRVLYCILRNTCGNMFYRILVFIAE